jgi:hypothetical protein
MSYDWPRIHKVEDNFYMEISDVVIEHVLNHYGVEEIEDLTQEQIDELETYRSCQLGEYSIMQVGYSNIINMWESQ